LGAELAAEAREARTTSTAVARVKRSRRRTRCEMRRTARRARMRKARTALKRRETQQQVSGGARGEPAAPPNHAKPRRCNQDERGAGCRRSTVGGSKAVLPHVQNHLSQCRSPVQSHELLGHSTGAPILSHHPPRVRVPPKNQWDQSKKVKLNRWATWQSALRSSTIRGAPERRLETAA
jgi:hypothetical protein